MDFKINAIFFNDDDNFLSNSSNHPFELDGLTWATIEHYFQANKYLNNRTYFEEVFAAKTAKDAFHIGRKYPMIENWNGIKNTVMKKALIAKFKTHKDIRKKLLDTNNSLLIKDNYNDSYWGSGQDSLGQNILGLLLMEVRKIYRNTCVLQSEKSYQNVSVDDILERYEIGSFFKSLPDNFLLKLRYFEPISGCFNQCSFCSQFSKKRVIYFDLPQLKNIISALKFIGLNKLNNLMLKDHINIDGTFSENFTMPSYGLIGDPIYHTPGIIYCYYDSDISIYPYLYEYIKYCFDDLGLKSRIATIGYSRHNKKIQLMHERINNDSNIKNSIDGLRLSYTVYTPGWIGKNPLLSRNEFINDIANFFSTYKPILKSLGKGERRFRVEMRFPPLIKIGIFEEKIIRRYHVIRCCNYLLISIRPKIEFQVATIIRSLSHSVIMNTEGIQYLMINSDNLNYVDWEAISNEIILNDMTIVSGLLKNHISRISSVYLFENADGVYYAIDPSFQTNRMFIAKHFYPSNEKRKNSGLIDSERFFLNKLISYKLSMGLEAKDTFENASWIDVENVLLSLKGHEKILSDIDIFASDYIKRYTIPLVSSYIKALKQADYPPSCFFDKNFTLDTGQICNIGRALNEYKELTNKTNLPLTPQHEKTFGEKSRLAMEETVWLLSLKTQNDSNFIHIEEQDLEKNWTDKDHLNKKVIANYEFKLDSGIIVDNDWDIYKIPGFIKE